MLVIMDPNATPEQCDRVEQTIKDMGFRPLPVPGVNRTAICVTGNKDRVSAPMLERLPGVREVIHVTKPYKLVSREVHPDSTLVTVRDAVFGGPTPVVIAGPCSVETEARTVEIARQAKASGAQVFRAGAYRPRTNPYSFQGLGEEGLHTLRVVRDEVGLPVVSEVMDGETAPLVADAVDILQIGARNMQNFSLLRRVGEIQKPILLKRGLSASLEEWLQAAEYLLSAGASDVILCERGIRTFNRYSRNTLDLNVVPVILERSHLPIIVDPSHGTGARDRVRALSRAALACGAHGLLIQAHTDPNTAYSDAAQTVDIPTLQGIIRDRDALLALGN